MPKTTTEISDHFTGIWVGAPEFSFLQRNAVRYPLSLEMMFGVLDAAVAGVASRCKSEEARTSYLRSLDELARAYHHYSSGEIELGQLRIQLAHHLFRWGALPRSRSLAEKYIDLLQKKLTESKSTSAPTS